MSASVWQPGGSSIAVNAENASLVQKFIASAGQTVFTLTQFSYVLATGSIRVYRNGVKLAASEVTELTATSFSLPGMVLEVGEVIECSAVLGSQDAVTAAAISAAASAVEAAASAASVAASNLVHITGTETIAGTKIFSAGSFSLNNLANTVASLFASAATSIRTWTFPDVSGTVVVTSTGKVGTTDTVDASITQAKLAPNVAGNGPCFVSQGTSASITFVDNASTVITAIPWVVDIPGCYNPANGRFTPSVAGYYNIQGSVSVGSGLTLSFAKLQLVCSNGNAAVSGLSPTGSGTDVAYGGGAVSLFCYFNGSTDYVTLNIAHDSSANKTGAVSATFSGFLARAA